MGTGKSWENSAALPNSAPIRSVYLAWYSSWCSAAGMLAEGGPSAVTADLSEDPALVPEEIRERMSGNLCRCGAYVNIVAAIADVEARMREGAR